jgi:DNA-binding MarR family transcriptional regulator
MDLGEAFAAARETTMAKITARKSPRADALKRRPGFLIRRMHQIHLALFTEECAAFDVTPVQYSIMTVTFEKPKMDQAALAYEVGVDYATLASVLARLEGKGLIRRDVFAADKRLKLISLTPKGITTLGKMRAAAGRAHERTIAALPAADRQRFMALLTRLVDAANEYGRAPLRLG